MQRIETWIITFNNPTWQTQIKTADIAMQLKTMKQYNYKQYLNIIKIERIVNVQTENHP